MQGFKVLPVWFDEQLHSYELTLKNCFTLVLMS